MNPFIFRKLTLLTAELRGTEPASSTKLMRKRDSSGHMTGKSGAKPEYAKTDRYRFFEFHHETTSAMVCLNSTTPGKIYL